MEGELASTTEALFHLELANVAAVGGLETLDLDDITLGLSVNDYDVPAGLADEWVILRVDVTWVLVFWQVVVGNSDGECNDVAGSDCLFTLNVDLVVNGHERHDLDHLLQLGKLGLVAAEEVEFGAFGRT